MANDRAKRYLFGLAAKLKAALLRAIFTDEVRPFVWVYYIALWIWGVYGTFFAAPPTYVKPVMGDLVYDLWVWLHIIATTIVMFGLSIESRAKPVIESVENAELRDDLRRAAIRLQTGGHACMFFVLLAYELSAIYSSTWGEGTYSIFVISPYVVGCLMLAMQGAAKLIVDRP